MRISRDRIEARARCVTMVKYLPSTAFHPQRSDEEGGGSESVHFYSTCVLGRLPICHSPHPFQRKHHQVVTLASHSMVYFNHILAQISESKGEETSATCRQGTSLCKSNRCTRVPLSKRTCLNRMQEKVQPANQEKLPPGGTAPCDARLQETLSARPVF